MFSIFHANASFFLQNIITLKSFKMKTSTIITFQTTGNFSHQSNETRDFFDPIFGNIYMKVLALALYFVGLIGGFALFKVIRYEASGQAGQYRTLLNQLVSQSLIMVRYDKINK